jgi:beta-glucosidase
VARPFPDGFIWGAATAAHQVEGGNVNSDCWALEHAKPSLFREPSGDAVDQYHRFADDVAILAGLGLKAYRFSIEWARIEPADGVFSQAALDHYQRCIDACLVRGVEPMLTFHHFTNPLWLARQGGFTAPDFADRFARYCGHAAKALSGYRFACTINELNLPLFIRDGVMRRFQGERARPMVEAAQAVLGGPLDRFFLFTPPEVIRDQGIKAHHKGRDAIKAAKPDVQVGITLALQDEQAEPGAEALRDQRRADHYEVCMDAAAGDDFIGVQNYSRVVAKRDGTVGPEAGHATTMMGYEDRPQALAAVCRWTWARTKTPIIVTENGWAGADDRRRTAFVEEALAALQGAMDEGVDVRGYFYWSLLDNFEWTSGYGPTFGLIGVDRTTQTRAIKGSAARLGEIARANSLEIGGDAAAERGSGAPVGV